MASANIKDVKRRIKSVQSTMQTTKAMELVASSKMRKAKLRAEAAQPFFKVLYDTMSDISEDKTFKSVFTAQNENKKYLLIVIAGDRGLAGGFNSNVLKLAVKRADEIMADGKSVEIMAIGKKAEDFFDKHNYPVKCSFSHVSENIDGYLTGDIVEIVLDGFRSKEYNTVELVFTTFVSALTQTPMNIQILPVENLDNGRDENIRALTIYDPSPEAVFDGMIPQYLIGILYSAIVDSFAAEQAARRTAMKSASDNAGEMIDQLSLLYNRARQGIITQELTEISSASLRDD
ncbi:MAG: ATP synthase F1 subunit gamma [Oscillospiraceae bacterium]